MGVYDDVEQLLFIGFLKEKLNFNGFDFVLKSLSESEIEAVRDKTPSYRQYSDIHYDCWFVCYSIFQINGVNFLADRDEKIEKLFNSLMKWPRKAIARLVSRCLMFNVRLKESYQKFEAYCYEGQSRINWKAYQNLPLTSVTVTGVRGTDMFPLNSLQIQWIAYNRAEDERQAFETNWSYVRWGGAFLNQKAAQKIEDEVKSQRDKEDEYKNKVMAKARGEIGDFDIPDFPSYRTKDDELKKLLYDLDVVINDKKDDHEIAMDRARVSALEEYREFRKKEQQRKIEAITKQSDYTAEGKQPFDIYDQVKFSDVASLEKRKELIVSVLGIKREDLDAIDKEYEVPIEILNNISEVSNLSKSTILPINFIPGNIVRRPNQNNKGPY